MKIIDAHVHFSELKAFSDAARISGVDYSAAGFQAECIACGVVHAVGMGLVENTSSAFPDNTSPSVMPCDLSNPPQLLSVCPGINPYTLDENTISILEKMNIAGVKIYAGYYPIYVDDPIYDPIYTLMARLRKPVVIHTGGTYSERGLLKYSHPLTVDPLAVKFRDVNFMLAHMGVPWVMDACEVADKNRNVYLDMSGLIVGDAKEIERVMNEPLLTNPYRQGLLQLNQYNKILYGTDWPLVPMEPYINFCKMLIPETHWSKVFYENAANLFSLQECG